VGRKCRGVRNLDTALCRFRLHVDSSMRGGEVRGLQVRSHKMGNVSKGRDRVFFFFFFWIVVYEKSLQDEILLSFTPLIWINDGLPQHEVHYAPLRSMCFVHCRQPCVVAPTKVGICAPSTFIVTRARALTGSKLNTCTFVPELWTPSWLANLPLCFEHPHGSCSPGSLAGPYTSIFTHPAGRPEVEANIPGTVLVM
jgi:hypothetical protein